MPAQPSYFHRLADAIDVFRSFDTDWIDRRTVEEVLGISKTAAWRILRRCGAVDGPGNTLICQREELIGVLAKVQSTGEFEREARRRNRLAGYLERLADVSRARGTMVATERQAVDLINARFDRLPPGITLTTRQLTVEFASPEEFLQRMGAVIFALQNDYESIREFIERGVRKH